MLCTGIARTFVSGSAALWGSPAVCRGRAALPAGLQVAKTQSWSSPPHRLCNRLHLASNPCPGCAAGLATPQLSALLPHHAPLSCLTPLLRPCTESAESATSACLQLGHQAHPKGSRATLALAELLHLTKCLFQHPGPCLQRMRPPVGHMAPAPRLPLLSPPLHWPHRHSHCLPCRVCSWGRPPSSSRGCRTRSPS